MGGWVNNATHRPLNPRERHTVPILEESIWAPRLVWMGANFSPHRDPIPGPFRS